MVYNLPSSHHVAPGPVSSLTVTVLNISSIIVLWSPVPTHLTNGNVQGYTVVLQEYQGDVISKQVVNSSELEATFANWLSKLKRMYFIIH